MSEDAVDTLTHEQTTLLTIARRLARLEGILQQVAIDTSDTAVAIEEIQDTLDEILGDPAETSDEDLT